MLQNIDDLNVGKGLLNHGDSAERFGG